MFHEYPITCCQVLELIEDYIDFELTLPAMEQVRSHLDRCDACIGRMHVLETSLVSLKRRMRVVAVPPLLAANLACLIAEDRGGTANH
jgi:anti-sigma factor RsiW